MSAVDRLWRAVRMMVAPVKITATNDTGPVHKAQLRVTTTGEMIDDVAVVQLYGIASHAKPGTDATAIFLQGDRSSPIVVATGNQAARLRNLKPGEVGIYTDEGDTVILKRGNLVEITTKTLTIHAPTSITLDTPQVYVTGQIATQGGHDIVSSGSFHATGEVTAKFGTSNSVGLSTHHHPALNSPPTPGT